MSDNVEHVNGTTEFGGHYDDASPHAEMDNDVEMTDAAANQVGLPPRPLRPH
jgi:hypothetical protein